MTNTVSGAEVKMASVVAAGSGFLRPAVAMRRSRVKGRSAGDDTGSPLQDLTSPSLTPWEVLGIDVATNQEVSIADVRRAYRARMKVYHPDVYAGDATDKQANARRVVAAYAAVARESGLLDSGDSARAVDWDANSNSEVFPWAREDADPFEEPEGPAQSVFVNEFACRGRGACPGYCCCVERNPGSFAWAEDTNAARFRVDAETWGDLNRRAMSTGASDAVKEDADIAAHRLNLAVGQCPEAAIHWVTPRQRTVLEGLVADAIDGTSAPNEAGARVYELLAKAKWENGRAAAPAASKRRAKASTRWVDWY